MVIRLLQQLNINKKQTDEKLNYSPDHFNKL